MSSEDKKLTPNEQAIEQLLRSVVPAPAKLNRDRLMFEAGAASVQTSHLPAKTSWYWPAATFTSTTLAGVLAMLLLLHGPTSRIEYVERPATEMLSQPVPITTPENSSLAVAPFGKDSFLKLRELAINDRWEWSDETAHVDQSQPVTAPKSQREMWNESLRESFEAGQL